MQQYIRQNKFNNNFENYPVIVQADPKLLAFDHQTKFKIMDSVPLRNIKEDRAKKVKQDGPVLESQMMQMNQTDFLRQVNVILAGQLENKKICPEKAECYKLDKAKFAHA